LSSPHPLERARRQIVTLAQAVESTDPTQVGRALSALASSRRILAPLGWAIGTILLLFQGLSTIVVNWRLTLIELVPAIWIGLTWWDLRVHALHKLELSPVHGAVLVGVAVGVIVVTVACYWCNAVFAMVVEPGHPRSIRQAFRKTRGHARYLNTWGLGVGIAHALASTLVVRTGLFAFLLAIGAVALVMMISFVTVPARLLGLTTRRPLPQKVSSAAVGGAISAVAQAPGFLLNRAGLLLLGVHLLIVPGIAVFAVGVALQTAAVSSVSAVKLSTQFVGAARKDDGPATGVPSVGDGRPEQDGSGDGRRQPYPPVDLGSSPSL